MFTARIILCTRCLGVLAGDPAIFAVNIGYTKSIDMNEGTGRSDLGSEIKSATSTSTEQVDWTKLKLGPNALPCSCGGDPAPGFM